MDTDIATLKLLSTRPVYDGGTRIEQALAAALAAQARGVLADATGSEPSATTWEAIASHLYLYLVVQPGTGGLETGTLSFLFAADAMAPAARSLSPESSTLEELGARSAPAWDTVLGVARAWLAARGMLATAPTTRN